MIPNNFHFVFGLRVQTEPWGPWWDRIKPKLKLRRIEPDQFISNYSYKDASLKPYKYAHLEDIARLDILLQEGGIYADIDILFLQPIPKDWFSRQFILGEEKPHAEEHALFFC